MEQISTYLQSVKIAKKQQHGNMTVFPLLSADGFAPDYLVLDQAMEADMVEVTEVDDEGDVPELRLVNNRMSDVRNPMSANPDGRFLLFSGPMALSDI